MRQLSKFRRQCWLESCFVECLFASALAVELCYCDPHRLVVINVVLGVPLENAAWIFSILNSNLSPKPASLRWHEAFLFSCPYPGYLSISLMLIVAAPSHCRISPSFLCDVNFQRPAWRQLRTINERLPASRRLWVRSCRRSTMWAFIYSFIWKKSVEY